jgi:hypothetical protein
MVPTRNLGIGMVAVALSAGPAVGAPTCQDFEGHVALCGSLRAMPVGWEPTAAQVFDRRPVADEAPSLGQTVAMLYVVGAPFDGRHGEDWDEQESDDRR